jgi:hypothetical protein
MVQDTYAMDCLRYSHETESGAHRLPSDPNLRSQSVCWREGGLDVNTAEVFSRSIQLKLGADAILGVGAFKTAQAAHLSLSPLRPSGLGF